jgi:hypothetical protein
MSTFKVWLDQDTCEKLVQLAGRDCRPTGLQAEWMLTQAIKRAAARLGIQPMFTAEERAQWPEKLARGEKLRSERAAS